MKAGVLGEKHRLLAELQETMSIGGKSKKGTKPLRANTVCDMGADRSVSKEECL